MSSRYVNPNLFTLRAVGQVEAARQQKAAPVREKYFAKSNGMIPMALRWSTTGDIGFPREPFQVFRRARASNDLQNAVQVMTTAQSLNGTLTLLVLANGDLSYFVAASLAVPSGSSITVQAVDASMRPITGQTVTLSGNGIAEFRCPGIAWLRFSGTGTVNAIRAVGENAYANLPDWQRIQTVGLPLKDKEIGSFYNTVPQGFEPPTMDGVQAAELRTALTALLQLQPAGSGLPDFPVPVWPIPDPVAYVDFLRSATSFVPMIERCLENSVDADPLKMQSLYTEQVTLEGIKQANVPGATADPSQTTTGELPVTGLSMMTVSTDSFAAVALGYGTVDIPPQAAEVVAPQSPTHLESVIVSTRPTLPSNDPNGVWDYMVTAPFVFPFGQKIVLAALSMGQPPVEAPSILQAVVKDVYTPLTRDAAASATIGVSWQPPTTPQGYAILVSRAANTSEVLNTPRPTAVHGYDPFVGVSATTTDPNVPPDTIRPGFSDSECVVPLKAPSVSTRYLVAGLDVFGLWSGWSEASATLAPQALAKPGVRAAQFVLHTESATGLSVPATLQVDFGWDWEDRSPGVIRLTGQFVPAPAAGLGPTAVLTALQMYPGQPLLIAPPATLTFSYASATQAAMAQPSVVIPAIDGAHTATGPVTVLKTSDFDPNNPQVTYRVEIPGFTLDFTSVTEIDYALYVTASEFIRPGEWSDATDPAMQFIGALVRTMDPFPPPMNFVPPAINWTALPDATGNARGVLEWTADAKATGYYVWEATESALNQILAPDAPDPPANTPLVMRGAALKTLVNANQAASLQGFARLNKDPIVGNRTEIVLPAAASTLYLYRISAISAGNVESSRSDQVAIFGVPRRNVPGAPRLLLRPVTTPQPGIKVIGLPVESGAPPAGYRVFRVRSAALSYDGSTMGPAKIPESSANWTPYAGTSLAGTPLTGMAVVDTAVHPSWYPYHYRIKAIGVADAANGLLSGESDFSTVQSAYQLPQDAPMLSALTTKTNATGILITLLTDLPAAVSPVGPALVEVLHLTTDPSQPKPVTTVVLSSAPDQIAVGTLKLPTGIIPLDVTEPVHPLSAAAAIKTEAPKVTVTPVKPMVPPTVTGTGVTVKPVGGTGVTPPVIDTLPPHPILPIKPPPPVPSLRRSDPDANEQWTLWIMLPYTTAQQNTYMIRLTDPLGRRTLKSF